MQDIDNLLTLVSALEYGSRYCICINLFTKWRYGRALLPVHKTIHTTPFCNACKQKPRGLRWCMYCQYLVQKKIARTKSSFSGFCINGVWEYNYPIVVDGEVRGIISVSNFVADPEAFCQKNSIAPTDPILQTMQIGYDETQCENVARIVDSYLRRLWTQYPQSIRGETENPTVRMLRDYIQLYFSQDLSLSMLAKTYHYNEKYLGRLFKQQTGYAFHDYLNKHRLDYAKKLLKDPSISVTDAALQSGFNNVTYFNRLFRQHFDVTPTQYRKKHK